MPGDGSIPVPFSAFLSRDPTVTGLSQRSNPETMPAKADEDGVGCTGS
jgi:hypothetical protein